QADALAPEGAKASGMGQREKGGAKYPGHEDARVENDEVRAGGRNGHRIGQGRSVSSRQAGWQSVRLTPCPLARIVRDKIGGSRSGSFHCMALSYPPDVSPTDDQPARAGAGDDVQSRAADELWMRRALALAATAGAAGEVPVGAVVVDAHGTLLGEGSN